MDCTFAPIVTLERLVQPENIYPPKEVTIVRCSRVTCCGSNRNFRLDTFATFLFIESCRLFHDYNNTKTLLLATERRPSLPFALRGRQTLSPALYRLA